MRWLVLYIITLVSTMPTSLMMHFFSIITSMIISPLKCWPMCLFIIHLQISSPPPYQNLNITKTLVSRQIKSFKKTPKTQSQQLKCSLNPKPYSCWFPHVWQKEKKKKKREPIKNWHLALGNWQLTLGHDSVNVVGIRDRPISGGTFFRFREMGLRHLPPTIHNNTNPFALLDWVWKVA